MQVCLCVHLPLCVHACGCQSHVPVPAPVPVPEPVPVPTQAIAADGTIRLAAACEEGGKGVHLSSGSSSSGSSSGSSSVCASDLQYGSSGSSRHSAGMQCSSGCSTDLLQYITQCQPGGQICLDVARKGERLRALVRYVGQAGGALVWLRAVARCLGVLGLLLSALSCCCAGVRGRGIQRSGRVMGMA